uniref:Retrotransposon gag domain-containing protein n=1 Tax=Cacopsylla melanoneura TaxID=428564 RepID=A0A8D9BN30_9HEMI
MAVLQNMASSPMSRADIKHLNKPELDHEIRIRGQVPLGKNENKRKQLHILIQRVQRGSVTVKEEPENIAINDAHTIGDRVTELVQRVKAANDRELSKSHSRYEARLSHYASRVKLWSETDEEVKTLKEELMGELEEADKIIDNYFIKMSTGISALPEGSENVVLENWDLLDTDDEEDDVTSQEGQSQSRQNEGMGHRGEANLSVPRVDTPYLSVNMEPHASSHIPRVDRTLDPTAVINDLRRRLNFSHLRPQEDVERSNFPRFSSQEEVERPFEPVSNYRPYVSPASLEPLKLYKWNLIFTGDDNKKTVEEFLDTLDVKCSAYRVSKQDLLPSAAELFEGTALTWYMANRSSFNSWRQLEIRLLTAFSPPLFGVSLWREILSRKQKEDESVVKYVSSMKILFNRMGGPIDNSLKLEIMVTNALPSYQEKLNFIDIHNVDDLESSMIRLETVNVLVTSRNKSTGDTKQNYQQNKQNKNNRSSFPQSRYNNQQFDRSQNHYRPPQYRNQYSQPQNTWKSNYNHQYQPQNQYQQYSRNNNNYQNYRKQYEQHPIQKGGSPYYGNQTGQTNAIGGQVQSKSNQPRSGNEPNQWRKAGPWLGKRK